MKKIPIKAYIDLRMLPKRVALRKLYADYNVTQKSDRKRCNKAWELLEGYLNANLEMGKVQSGGGIPEDVSAP